MLIWLRSNLSKKFAEICRTCTLATMCHLQAVYPVKNSKATFLLGSFDTREVTNLVTPVQLSYIPGISHNCKEALISTKYVSYQCLSVPRAVELTNWQRSGIPTVPVNFHSPLANAIQVKVLAAPEGCAVTWQPLHIQGVPGGMCQTSGGCSLC